MLTKNILFVASALTLALSACTVAKEPDAGNDEPESKKTELTSEEGGVAESPDGSFTVALDAPDIIDETVTVTVTEESGTFDSAAALSPAYVVDVEGQLAIGFTAEITFDLPSAKAEEVTLANIRVAHGEALSEEWDELREGTYDSELEKYSLIVSSFSYFMLIDESKVGGNNEETQCDESCMSQSGAGCCTTCGCEVEVVCRPACGSGLQWDCELECCFDYENTVCAG